MQKQLKKVEMNPSNIQSDRMKATMIERLVTLYEKKYLLHRSDILKRELCAYTYYKADNHFQFPEPYLKTIRLLFNEEYLFTKEAFAEINLISECSLANHDFLRLLETVLRTNWQYSNQPENILSFIELIHSLLEIISCRLKVSTQFFESSRTSFLHHIKFLALKIQQKEIDYSTSDNDLYFFLEENHREAFSIAENIRKFITETYDFDLSNNDITYLVLHLIKSLGALTV
ncbi:PRD domain-containing protein [Enterococcus sp. BWB1-3]|uniref:PRD domain-containing protein n=1 Tax=Enterococcus sp. BWB1-3 TaxID=2787713 RepID=UPI001922BBDE|nr:PRD domain-containing protein [Enterococcus sp. BWB1-3]MBL1228393.1 PRD domain-containing protein [Enterococcus sp. BWB1-3]